MSFFILAPNGDPIAFAAVFGGVTARAKLCMIPSLLRRGYVSVADVNLVYVTQCVQFAYGQVYLDYHHALKVDWDDEACVWSFPYISLSLDVLDTPAKEVLWRREPLTMSKRGDWL